jgi:two-component system chemotaxis sensor kinase CheA
MNWRALSERRLPRGEPVTRDPFRYFRIEAQEIIDTLGRGLLELEKGGDQEAVRQLLRAAHTLKGAARVVKQVEIGDLAHRIEDLLAPHRNSPAESARESVEPCLAMLDEIRRRVAMLGKPPETQSRDEATKSSAADDSFQTVRVRVADLDRLLEGISEAVAGIGLLHGDARDIRSVAGSARTLFGSTEDSSRTAGPRALAKAGEILANMEAGSRRLLSRTDQVRRELAALKSAAFELRLVPAQVLVAELERSVRDAATSLG